MIQNETDYRKAKQELEHMENWLARVERDYELAEKGLTKAGIRKMIARLHEELAQFEGTVEVESARR